MCEKHSKISVVLAVVMVFMILLCFCGCQKGKTVRDNGEIAQGYVEGNIYKNELFELKFKKPAEWVFYENLGVQSNGQILSMAADYNAFRVEIAYVEIKNSQTDTRGYLGQIKQTLSELGWNCGEIGEKEFCGKNFLFVDSRYVSSKYRSYVRESGNYILCINIFATEQEIDNIEKMFSAI